MALKDFVVVKKKLASVPARYWSIQTLLGQHWGFLDIYYINHGRCRAERTSKDNLHPFFETFLSAPKSPLKDFLCQCKQVLLLVSGVKNCEVMFPTLDRHNTAIGRRDSNVTNISVLRNSCDNTRQFVSPTSLCFVLHSQVISFPVCGYKIIVAQYCSSLLDRIHGIWCSCVLRSQDQDPLYA